MRIRISFGLFVIAFLIIGDISAQPTNPNASELTKTVYQNLMTIQKQDRIIFGQYFGTVKGVESNNDIYDITGIQPGMTEWHIPFLKSSDYPQMQIDFEHGMLIGMFWRMNNPITGNNETDETDGQGNQLDIATLLPGGEHHDKYLKELDKMVEINKKLPQVNGEPIPISFRFLPEMSMGTGRWYKLGTPEQYKQLWRVAHEYLSSEGCNNLLWQFNPNLTYSADDSRNGYKEYYPGHDYVDICGRNMNKEDYEMGPDAMNSMRHAITVAAEANKLVAVSQMNTYNTNGDWNRNGVRDGKEPASIPNYWTERWLDRIHTKDSLLNKIAFSCAWKNNTDLNYFLPYKSHEHAADFAAFCNTPQILLAPDLDIYTKNGDSIAPSVPGALQVNEILGNSCHLTWRPSTDNDTVTRYYIYNKDVFVAATNDTSAWIAGLEFGVIHEFTAKASDAVGNLSAPSNVVTVEIPVPEPPAAPSNLTYSDVTANSCRLKWDASAEEGALVEYQVYMNGALAVSVSDTFAVISGLGMAIAYTFSVKAKNSFGILSSASNEVTLIIPDMEGPTAPTNLSVSQIKATSLSLSWSASSDNVAVVEYEVYKDDDLELSTWTTYTTIDNLINGTEYTFTVKAKDAAGNTSEASSPVAVVTPDNEAPTAPSNLSASSITDSSCVLTWYPSLDNLGVSGYDVYQDGELEVSVTDTIATLDGLQNTTSYTFMVKAKDEAGNISPASKILSVTTSSPLVLDSDISKNQIILYPNPVTGLMMLGNASNGTVSVNGLDGHLVYKKDYVAGQSIDLTALEAGMYLLRLTGDKTVSIKFIKE